MDPASTPGSEPGSRPVVGPGAPPTGPLPPGRVTRATALTLSTGLGVGLLPGAPGTYGSALAVGIFVVVSPMPGSLLLLSLLALGALGVWSADVAERVLGRTDDGRIVIDEVLGQLVALAPLWVLVPGSAGSWPWLVTGFVAFRCFDITKPGPVGWAERHFRGGLGVMMDDVVAGGLAALLLTALVLALPLSDWRAAL